jgi:uncharacterized protein with GYD domain
VNTLVASNLGWLVLRAVGRPARIDRPLALPDHPVSQEVFMPRYVVLIDWTEQGVRGFKDSVDRYEGANSQLEGLGVRFADTYWTLGNHDIVSLVDAPDDESLAAGLLAVAGAGNIRTTTLRAFSADEMRGVIGKVA